MRAETVAPQGIAGGFVLVPVRQVLAAWRACRRGPLGIGDFRTWLACHEMVARRCTLDHDRAPAYGVAELSRLTGVSPRRARASVKRLVAAGLLTWSDEVIGFPDGGSKSEPDAGDDTLVDTIGGGQGSLAFPRRILRLLVGGARPALIATGIAVLLRCLARGGGGVHSRGRVKATWIARAFDIDVRRVKQARGELVDLGWMAPEPDDQWAMNRWGRAYRVDLGWDRPAPREGPRLAPPPPQGGRRLPPPDSNPEPLRGDETQEPAPGGPAGIEIKGEEEKPNPTPPAASALAPARSPSLVEKTPGSTSRRPAPVTAGEETSPATVEPGPPLLQRPSAIADGAGGGTPPVPTLNDVRIEDLKDTGRLFRLHAQAVARGLVSPSEADRLRFFGAAEHALALGEGNPPGLFMYLVRGRHWRYLTQADEDRAYARLKRELRGEPPRWSCVGPVASWGGPVLSEDALVVREVRLALIGAGHYRDPYTAFARVTPGWTRGRWDRALSELGL